MAIFYGSKEHTAKMAELFKNEIEKSVKNSSVIRSINYVPFEDNEVKVDIVVEDLTTSGAITKYKDLKNLCALNFASFLRPGGSFNNVPTHLAQEEYICKDSVLYNVLKEFQDEYDKNKSMKNRNLYENFAIYSPDVVFVDDSKEEVAKCDILTCAAPNATAASTYGNMSDESIKETMYDRIDFLLTVAKEKGVKNIILGAFGCGVFGNDPEFVAKTFKKLLRTKNYGFEKVSFSIPGGSNLKAFKDIFEV